MSIKASKRQLTNLCVEMSKRNSDASVEAGGWLVAVRNWFPQCMSSENKSVQTGNEVDLLGKLQIEKVSHQPR